ncbi:MAG: hypothetical protein ACJ743_09985 [Gaiellaceae bacterium]
MAQRDDDGEAYAVFIEKELADQRASKTSMEQRCIAVVSTSGVLVTLLFGFAAIARKSSEFQVPDSARLWFYLALGSFVIAAVAGLVGNSPRKYRGAKSAALEHLLREKWSDPPRVARRRVARTHVVIYHSYRRVNRFKAFVLTAAITSEVVAVLFLAVAIGLVIEHS